MVSSNFSIDTKVILLAFAAPVMVLALDSIRISGFAVALGRRNAGVNRSIRAVRDVTLLVVTSIRPRRDQTSVCHRLANQLSHCSAMIVFCCAAPPPSKG